MFCLLMAFPIHMMETGKTVSFVCDATYLKVATDDVLFRFSGFWGLVVSVDATFDAVDLEVAL